MSDFLTIEHQVQLKPYHAPKPRSYNVITEQELRSYAGQYLIIDTENYENYFLIAFKLVGKDKYFLLEPPFDNKLLSWILHSFTTIGFNSIKYDMPLVWFSYYNQDLQVLKQASNELINGIFQVEFCNQHNIKIFPTKHIDLIEVCPLRGSLKLYGGRLHAQRIQDVPFNPYGTLTQEQINIVQNYCINDLDTTELLLNNLKEQLALREQLSRQYGIDLMSKSDAQIAESVISKELHRRTGSWPKKPKIEQYSFRFAAPVNMQFQTEYLQYLLESIERTNFSLDEYGRLDRTSIKDIKINLGQSTYRMGIGGLHSSEENIAWKSNEEYQIFDRDVASYYPAIVLNCELYPSHLGADFLKVYRDLVNRRIEAKKAKRIAESENLKVTINGTFGKTGSPHSVIYAPEMTIQITVGGQLYLLMLIEALELKGISVISANTDGIVIYCRRNMIAQYETVIKEWEQQTGFITEETKYSAIYSRDVNAYMAIKDGEVKGKNILYDPWRGKTAKDAYWRFQKNPNLQICVEAIEQLILNNIPIEQTIKQCKDITKFVAVRNVKGGAHKNGEYLGKTIRWYLARNIIGTINYISSNNRVPDTDGAFPCMDIPITFPDNIDYDKYIAKTIDMLYDIGYLKRAEQGKLF